MQNKILISLLIIQLLSGCLGGKRLHKHRGLSPAKDITMQIVSVSCIDTANLGVPDTIYYKVKNNSNENYWFVVYDLFFNTAYIKDNHGLYPNMKNHFECFIDSSYLVLLRKEKEIIISNPTYCFKQLSYDEDKTYTLYSKYENLFYREKSDTNTFLGTIELNPIEIKLCK